MRPLRPVPPRNKAEVASCPAYETTAPHGAGTPGALKPVSWTSVIGEAFRKLSPSVQLKNPVMFVVYLGSIITTFAVDQALTGKGEAPAIFIFAVAAWLWFTVLFANAAEALAEGRGKAQADALRATRQKVVARMLKEPRRDSEILAQPSDELDIGALCPGRSR